jgi:hypothetical protein
MVSRQNEIGNNLNYSTVERKTHRLKVYQKIVRFFRQLCFGQINCEEDCDDADDVSRVADEPVDPVEDRTSRRSRVATEQRHEGLDEAKACRDAAQNLKVNIKLKQNL